MQHSEDIMVSQPSLLPALPGMLAKAVPTVARNGKVDDALENIQGHFAVESIDVDVLRAYKQQFVGLVSEYPLTFFYLIAQRAHLAMMLDKRFPWPILGMVHVANKMQWIMPYQAELPLTLKVDIQIPPRAGTRKRVRLLYVVEFLQNDHSILRCESTYQVGSGGKSPANRRLAQEQLDLSAWEQLDIWHLDAASGRRYARLSGDYNPIHLHPWLSRWFGFSQPIIHGMYSVARIQADIERHYGKPVQQMDVMFKRPMALPTEGVSHIHPATAKLCVSDAQGEKSYLDGVFHL